MSSAIVLATTAENADALALPVREQSVDRADAGRQVGEPAGGDELGHVLVVVEDVGEAGAGRERRPQGRPS